MKTLEQLGISPTPWNVAMDDIAMVFSGSQYPSLSTLHICEVDIIDDPERKCNDIKLIAAAPELYEALRMYQETFAEIRKSAWFLDANFHEIMSLNKVMTAADAALAKAAEGSEVKNGER